MKDLPMRYRNVRSCKFKKFKIQETHIRKCYKHLSNAIIQLQKIFITKRLIKPYNNRSHIPRLKLNFQRKFNIICKRTKENHGIFVKGTKIRRENNRTKH